MIITSDIIKLAFKDKEPFCADATYATFTEKELRWYCKRFYFCAFRRRTQFWKKTNDCDDKAQGMQWNTNARYSWYRKDGAQSRAIGEVWYHVDGDPKKGHAINVAFISEGDRTCAEIFFEPQVAAMKGRLVVLPLTQDELDSIYFLRF